VHVVVIQLMDLEHVLHTVISVAAADVFQALDLFSRVDERLLQVW